MRVGLERYKALEKEIQTLRDQKVGELFKYSRIKDSHPNYRDRRQESRLAQFTRKINNLEDIKARYENS